MVQVLQQLKQFTSPQLHLFDASLRDSLHVSPPSFVSSLPRYVKDLILILSFGATWMTKLKVFYSGCAPITQVTSKLTDHTAFSLKVQIIGDILCVQHMWMSVCVLPKVIRPLIISGLFFISERAAIGRPQFATGPQKCCKTQTHTIQNIKSMSNINHITLLLFLCRTVTH